MYWLRKMMRVYREEDLVRRCSVPGENFVFLAFSPKTEFPCRAVISKFHFFIFFCHLFFFSPPPNIVFKVTLLFVNLKNDGWCFKIIFTIHWLVAGRVAAAPLTQHGWLAGRPGAGLWLFPSLIWFACLIWICSRGKTNNKTTKMVHIAALL